MEPQPTDTASQVRSGGPFTVLHSVQKHRCPQSHEDIQHILIHRPLGKTQDTNHILPEWSTNIINMALCNTRSHYHSLPNLSACLPFHQSFCPSPLCLSKSVNIQRTAHLLTYVNTTLSKMKQHCNAMYLHRIQVKHTHIRLHAQGSIAALSASSEQRMSRAMRPAMLVSQL